MYNICMALFQKKTTLVHHITYMGIMTAINLIFIVLATYIPLMMLLLILLLPFASTVVSYFCLKRYYLIYAVASIGLCMIFNISDTLFYVVPAIISGFFIGILLEKGVHPFWLVLCSTIINAALTYAFIPLINLISNADIVLAFLTIFGLKEFPYRSELVFLFVFLISLIQCALTHFVLLSDAKKLGIQINTRVNSFGPIIVGLELCVLLAICFGFFYLPLSLVFVAISFYFSAFVLTDLMMAKKIFIYVVSGLAVFIGLLLFALFYQQLTRPYGVIVVIIFPLLLAVVSFVKNYLLKH